MNQTRPSVGVGVLIQNNGKLIFGKRIGAHGKNTWSVPGGYLEFGESFEACAIRETFEETGIKIKNPTFFAVVNNVFDKEKHHSITIFLLAQLASGTPKTTEPDKFIEVDWYNLKDLPQPLFLPMIELKKLKPELFS